jgi:hypothetical protein
MKKSQPTKHVLKTQSFYLLTNAAWNTMQAQVLAKISVALDPPQVDFSNYDITFYIARVLLKPSLLLATKDDFNVLLGFAHLMSAKDPNINTVISQKVTSKHGQSEKENEGGNESDRDKPMVKKVHIA